MIRLSKGEEQLYAAPGSSPFCFAICSETSFLYLDQAVWSLEEEVPMDDAILIHVSPFCFRASNAGKSYSVSSNAGACPLKMNATSLSLSIAATALSCLFAS